MNDTPSEPSESPAAEPRNRDRWFAVLTVLVCLLVTTGSVVVVNGGLQGLLAEDPSSARVRDGVRNPDEAAYAQQAECLLEGRDLTSDVIRHYHVKKPAEITHPEDFYPPGNGALIALSWSMFGRSDAASTYPSILISSLILPLLTAFLALSLGATWPFAFGAALMVMFEPLVRFQALQGLADLPLTAAVLGATILSLRPSLLGAILTGAVLGLGFWLKPGAILFVPALALAIHLSRPRDSEWPFKRRAVQVLAFGLAFLAISSPWMIRNAELFGDPIYTGNKHLTATANHPDFDFDWVRKVFWDGIDDTAENASVSQSFFESLVQNAGHAGKRFLSHLLETVEFHGASMFGWAFVIAAVAFFRNRKVRSLTAAILIYVVALSAVFAIEDRYLLPLFPVTVAMSFLLASRVATRLRDADSPPLQGGFLLHHPGRLALCLTLLAVLPQGLPFGREVINGKTNFVPPYDTDSLVSADWSAQNLPDDAVVMANEALRFHHRTGLKAINTPWDRPEAIEAVVEHYRVTHIVRTASGDSTAYSNPAIQNYLRDFGNRWKRVWHGSRGFQVWERLPPPEGETAPGEAPPREPTTEDGDDDRRDR